MYIQVVPANNAMHRRAVNGASYWSLKSFKDSWNFIIINPGLDILENWHFLPQKILEKSGKLTVEVVAVMSLEKKSNIRFQGPKCSVLHRSLRYKATVCVIHSSPCVAKNNGLKDTHSSFCKNNDLLRSKNAMHFIRNISDPGFGGIKF